MLRLPNEGTHPATFKELVWLAAGAALILVGANVLAGWLLAEVPVNRGLWLVQQKWALLDGLEEPVDCLVLGDSAGNQGVVVEQLEEQLGIRALNLCTLAQFGTVDDAWMLRAYLERFGAPRVVVLVHTYQSWGRQVHPQLLATVPRPLGYWEELVPPLQLGLREEVEVAAYRYLPLYYQDQSLAYLLRRPEVAWRLQTKLEPGGYMRIGESERSIALSEDLEAHLAELPAFAGELNETSRRALEEAIELAGEHGFDLLIVTAPVYSELWRRPAFQATVNRLTANLLQLCQDHPRVELHPKPLSLPASEMELVDHTLHPGAVRFTRHLAEIIAPHLAHPADPKLHRNGG